MPLSKKTGKYVDLLQLSECFHKIITQTYMLVIVDGITVFKEENDPPLTFKDMHAQFRGVGSYPYADAKIRKLLIRSFDF